MGFGWMELLIVFGIILLLFGASRLPKIARSMGLSVGKFKEGIEEGKKDQTEEPDDPKETPQDNNTDDDDEIPTIESRLTTEEE